MIALTGATGLVGQWLLPLADVTLGRQPCGKPWQRWSLTGPAPDLTGVTTLIHAAFHHAPGKYRGGEGDDPDAFIAANLHGTLRLFTAAAAQGVERILFLSSRAVFDGLPEGTDLPETRAPNPKSLYGQVKAQAEDLLFDLPLTGLSLRATGIYGPSAPSAPPHKWTTLFADHRAGRPIAPRRGTELHGQDLTQAARLLLTQTQGGPVHLSDMILDRHDLLTEVNRLTGCPHPPPPCADTPVSPLSCDRLHALGWHPGGMARLKAALPAML
ncbi:NAD-dependent epimerase/dehydratase family protein [Sagittula sp. S175]|uniref:NAD-dependent epimerase/dehydratase family protein n=1 Tax=Sagittula sp. S175 TaxID=3415129 RepID=UPI003C7A8E5F